MASEKLSAAFDPRVLGAFIAADADLGMVKHLFSWCLGDVYVTARSGAQLPEAANRCSSLCGRMQRKGPHLSSEQPKPSDMAVMCHRVHSPAFGAPVPARAVTLSPESPRLLGVPGTSP